MSFKIFDFFKFKKRGEIETSLPSDVDSATHKSVKTLTLREYIAFEMKCDLDNLTLADELAISTVLIPSKLQKQSPNSVLCNFNINRLDTLLFSAFMIRAVLMGSTDNHEKAYLFCEEYLKKVILGAKVLYYSSSNYFDEMFNNRMAIYDSAFMSKSMSQFMYKSGVEVRLSAVLEKFKYILAFDIIDKQYFPLYEDSPLPLLDIFEMTKCEVQIANFVSRITDLIDPYYKQALDFLQE